jgi:hypothetical protein
MFLGISGQYNVIIGNFISSRRCISLFEGFNCCLIGLPQGTVYVTRLDFRLNLEIRIIGINKRSNLYKDVKNFF